MGTLVWMIILGAFALFVIVLIVSGLKIVQQAQVMVIERLGRYSRTLDSGVNVTIPLIEKPRSIYWRYAEVDVGGKNIIRQREITRIDLRETVYDFPKQNVITRDNVNIEINALIYFQITDPVKAVYEIANLPEAIEKLTQTTLRNVIGEMDLDDTLKSRDMINARLREILDEATDKWGVKVHRVELQDINPPPDIKEAMEKQMRAERDKRKMILEAEGEKTAAVQVAEGQRQAQITEAEGKKQAEILIAEGQAIARLRLAEAESEAIKKVTEAIGDGNPANYLVAIKYIDALKEITSGKENKLVFMPYEASGILGSIGGIKEMLKGV